MMKESAENKKHNKAPFLKGEFVIEDIDKNHEELLGYQIPDDYFSTSKKEILKKVRAKKGTVINLRFLVPIAAAITLLITLTVFKPSSFSMFKNVPSIVLDTIQEFKNSTLTNKNEINLTNDVSIASLFVEDAELDEFVDDYVIDQIILEELQGN